MLKDTSALLSDSATKTVIRKSEIFKGLEHETLAKVLGTGAKRTFSQGDNLTIEGTEGECFYVVESGTVDVIVKSGEQANVVSHLGPGAVVGEVSLLCNRPRTATVTVTSEQLCAFEFDKAAFEQITATLPEIHDRLSKIAVPRIQRTMRQLYS